MQAGLTYVSTLNNPHAVRLHEISMSWDNSPEAILGPVLPTKPNASPIWIALCNMIYPRSSSRDMAYLSMSEQSPDQDAGQRCQYQPLIHQQRPLQTRQTRLRTLLVPQPLRLGKEITSFRRDITRNNISLGELREILNNQQAELTP